MTQAPTARRAPGDDPYVWLESRDAPEVLAHLEAENAYLEAQLAPEAALREQLFEEIRARIRETDLSLPVPRSDYLYYQRTQAGDEYGRNYRCRRPADGDLTPDPATEELLFDGNAIADGGFLSVGRFTISPDQTRLAYSLDQVGDETYRLYVKELATGAVTELPFEECDGSLTWANDSRTLFFGERDESHRPHKLYRYHLGDAEPQLVFHETDGRFFLGCYRSSSERKLLLLSHSKTTSEAWVLDADRPDEAFVCLAPREEGHEYFPDHGVDGWYVRSNQDGINFALYQAAEESPTRSHWQLLVPHDPEVMLEDASLGAQALVLSLRTAGLPILEVRPYGQAPYRVDLPDEVYSLDAMDVLEFNSPVMRLRYEALNRPAEVRELDLASGTQRVLKQVPVEGPFDADAYESRRLWATAANGTRIPISLVGRRDLPQSAPLYLYGYGAYGHSLDPWFSHARLSLLDRGVRFAIAHVRGGGELGEAWYRSGKLEHKQNTFDDFIACTEHLLDQGLTTPQQVVISGGSAGGLLIGAVLNQRPELYAGAIAEVPFVDVLNTMLKPDLPLTVTEYDEWGDPNEPEVRDRIASYAPYENVKAQAYPAILAVAGYHDTRVQYWEAAKWVARLRELRTDQAPLLLLKTEFGAGHGGMSGRYQALRDVALEYAFVFRVLGLTG